MQGSNGPAIFPNISVFSLPDPSERVPETEAPEVISLRAEAEAQALLKAARGEADCLRREAAASGYAEGYAAGFAKGEEEARAELNARAEQERTALRADLEAFLLHVETVRQQTWEAMEPEMIGLVFDLVQAVIHQEVEVNRTIALASVRAAIQRVAASGALRIRIHERDLETVRAHRRDLLALLDGIDQVEIVGDQRISPGGCVVETDNGAVDATLETRLAALGSLLEQTAVQDRNLEP